MKPLRIVFMGSPRIAVPCLLGLIEAGHEIVEVWTQPDKPSGRGKRLHAPEVKIAALEQLLKVFQPKVLKNPEVINHFYSLKADLVVVIAYGKILPSEMIHTPKFGCVNVHFSLLPKHRGSACIAQAILAGDGETGISSMLISDGEVDSGPVLLQDRIAIGSEDTAGDISEKLSYLAPTLLNETIQLWVQGKIQPQAQDASKITVAHKLIKDDARVHWEFSAEQISRMVRAYHPWPGAFCYLQDLRVSLLQVDICKTHRDLGVGELRWEKNMGLYVGTGEGILELIELKPEGKKNMSGEEFARGYLRD